MKIMSADDPMLYNSTNQNIKTLDAPCGKLYTDVVDDPITVTTTKMDQNIFIQKITKMTHKKKTLSEMKTREKVMTQTGM